MYIIKHKQLNWCRFVINVCNACCSTWAWANLQQSLYSSFTGESSSDIWYLEYENVVCLWCDGFSSLIVVNHIVNVLLCGIELLIAYATVAQVPSGYSRIPGVLCVTVTWLLASHELWRMTGFTSRTIGRTDGSMKCKCNVIRTDTPEILIIRHFKKIVPSLEVSASITSSSCSDSLILSWDWAHQAIIMASNGPKMLWYFLTLCLILRQLFQPWRLMNPENIKGDTDTPELSAEGDIQMDTLVISWAAQT